MEKRTIKVVKKVARNEFISGHRKTVTQIIPKKIKYTRKIKHKGKIYE